MWGLGVVAAGVGLRLADAFPDHRFPDEADCALTGITALKILGGHLRVFASGVRLGAFESYLVAGWFAVFGVSHAGLSVGPILGNTLALVFFWLFAREVFGLCGAVLALLFFAIPSPAYDFYTSLPVSYSQTMMFASAVLWLSARIARTGENRWTVFGLGLAAGLGWWNCLLTLAVTAPSLLWLAHRRPEIARRPRFVALLAFGFLLGASPWIAFNLRYPLRSFHGDFATRVSTTFFRNARHFVGYDLRELVVSSDSLGVATPASWEARSARIAVFGVYTAALSLFLWNVIHPRRRRAGDSLLVLVLLATAALNLLSEAGSRGGMTVRYALPAYFTIVVALTRFCQWTWSRSRAAAVCLAGIVLSFNLATYFWPWTSDRREWRLLKSQDQRELAFLEERRVGLVVGTYWDSYPINFSSRMRIKGIPLRRADDSHGIENTIGSGPLRCAVVASNLDDLREIIRQAGLPGRIFEIAPTSYVFLPDPNSFPELAPAEFLSRVRFASFRPRSSQVRREDAPASGTFASAHSL